MKVRILLASMFALAAMNASATAVCNGDSGGDAPVSAGTDFVKTDFNMTCSKNVFLDYDENTVQAAVCANSKKGKFAKYGGTTEGGAVKQVDSTECPSTGCVAPTAALNTGC
jgi:hypothetical protein